MKKERARGREEKGENDEQARPEKKTVGGGERGEGDARALRAGRALRASANDNGGRVCAALRMCAGVSKERWQKSWTTSEAMRYTGHSEDSASPLLRKA